MTKVDELYQCIDIIGRGGYGEVYKAREIKTGEIVAMKKISRNTPNMMDNGFPVTTYHEIILLKMLNHENIVNLRHIFTDRSTLDVYLVFNYTEYDLDYIISRIPLTSEHIKSYTRQLLLGLYVIHARSIYHRDLKPQNILVDKNNLVQIADFGLAKQIFPNSQEKLEHAVITVFYRPLEVYFKQEHYGKDVDIWSIGCIIYEMLSDRPNNKQLFFTSEMKPNIGNNKEIDKENDKAVVNQIFKICGYPTEQTWPGWEKLPKANEYMLPPEEQPKGNLKAYLERDLPERHHDAIPLLLSILQYNPEKRPSIKKILKHPYLRSSDGSLDPSKLSKLKLPEKAFQIRPDQRVQNPLIVKSTKIEPPPIDN